MPLILKIFFSSDFWIRIYQQYEKSDPDPLYRDMAFLLLWNLMLCRATISRR